MNRAKLLTEKYLSQAEQLEIESNIREDLVDHLFDSIPMIVMTGLISSVLLLLTIYEGPSVSPEIIWLFVFGAALFLLLCSYLYYKKYKANLGVAHWENLGNFLILLNAACYGGCILFMPSEIAYQLLLLSLIFIMASAFSMATVGNIYLCTFSLVLILSPITTWFLFHTELYYRVADSFIAFYFIFLVGMNRQNTFWFKHALKLKLENSSFTHQVNYDFLTNLPNQRLLSREIENAIQSIKGSEQKLGLVCFSVNRLETIYNSLGYQAGDLIVQSLANRLKALLEENSKENGLKTKPILTLPRPNVFMILSPIIEIEKFKKEVQNLFSVLQMPYHVGLRDATFTASIGVSIYPEHGSNVRELLTNAYAAMFQAKQQGGNQIEYYEQTLSERAPKLLELENDLSHALEHQEFVIFYQPIIDLESEKISGMEALIRWKHPKYGFISPTDFIPLAEEAGLIVRIGAWVLEQACIRTRLWHQQDFPALKLSVNLSAKQLQSGKELLETIEYILEKTKLDPECLELELTETEILDENLSPIIKAITKKGITLAIDDFGTGYSGLSYLKFFDIDKIKIDKSFIQDVTHNEESATIVSAILAMAKELNIKVLAEGVETEEQLAFLKIRGCSYIQGYYFSKPIPADEFTKLLENGGGLPLTRPSGTLSRETGEGI